MGVKICPTAIHGIATLDDDLEHSPKSIHKMINYLKKYNFDVVFENNTLKKNFFRNFSSKINQYLIKKVFNLKNNLIRITGAIEIDRKKRER